MKKFFILILMVVATMTSCTLVDSGEVGIRFKKFSLTDQGTLSATPVSGFVIYNPFVESVYTYPVFIQRVDYQPFTVTTKDAAVFTMDPQLAYQLNREKATDIFAKYRRPLRDIETGYMRTCIYDAYRIIANNYTSDELMANRGKFEAEVRAMLDENLGTEGFDINEFTSQITPPQSLQASIDSKNKAIQESLRAKNEVEKAKAEAEIAIAKAEGDAKAMRIKADAEAYYNMKISSSLTHNIVLEDWIEKWDGKLPQMQGNSNMVPMVNFNK
jgi:regulator of protease activity HflC (stomatin/prohibitin superfamily)